MNSGADRNVVLYGLDHAGLEAIREILERNGFKVRRVQTLEALEHFLESVDVSLIVARLCSCLAEALDLPAALADLPAAPPVVFVVDGADVRSYLEGMERGAFDCVVLPVEEGELLRIVARAMEERRAEVVSGERK